MSDVLSTVRGVELLGGARSIPALFLSCVDRDPSRVAFTVPADQGFAELPTEGAPGAPQGWRHLRLVDSLRNIAGLAVRLRTLGVRKGTPVAILAETSSAWAALDLATLSLGGVVVGIYPTLPAAEVAWQLRHCKAELLVVEDEAQHRRMAPHLEGLDELRHVLSMKPGAEVPVLAPAMPDEDVLREQIQALGPQDRAAIVYTSGTTGESKGVILTHGHFLANIAATALAEPVAPGTRSIVFLPLAHSLQRFALYRGLLEEASGWFSPSIEALPQVIAASRPQLLVTVPRMLEKIKARAEARAAAAGRVPAALLRWAVAVGTAAFRLEQDGQPLPHRLRLQRQLAHRLVARRVKAGLGGSLEKVVSGGAALSVEVGEWFEAMGIVVCEGWGLTETCAPATLCTTAHRRMGTVGRALPGVELRIAEDGEVMVRGPGVFEGYLDAPQASAESFVQDDRGRWFLTGDQGSLDADGYLKITGRKKAIIVTSSGKNIAPAPIEKALEGDLIEQAVVLGDERPYLVALLRLDEENVAARGLSTEQARQAIAARVQAVNSGLPRFAQVKRWELLPEPLSIETGELTATLKIRRQVVVRRHAERIRALYERSEP